MYLLEMVYHLNGSVRGKLAIHDEDLRRLDDMYDFYMAKIKDVKEKAGLFGAASRFDCSLCHSRMPQSCIADSACAAQSQLGERCSGNLV